MKRSKLWIGITGLLFALALQASPAFATWPSIDIALWDPHFAKQDRQDPEYLKVLEHAEKGEFAQALELAERLIQERPSKGTPVILKSLLLYELGRYRDAHETLLHGRRIQPRHPAIHYANCEIYRMLGVVDLSKRGCGIAVNQHQKLPEAHYEYALTLAANGEMNEANLELELASELAPKNPVYPYERGMNYFYLNDLAAAEKAFLKAVELDPKHLDALYQLGYLHAIRGELEKSQSYLERLYEMRTNHPKVDSARQLIEMIKTGRVDELPKTVIPHQYHMSRSRSLYQSGEYGLALFEIQTAARLNPTDKPTQEILVGLSSLLLRLELTEISIENLLAHIDNDPILRAKSYQEMGDLQALRGNMKEARKFYQKAMELGDPDNLAKTSLSELPPNDHGIPSALDQDELFFLPAEALNRRGELFSHYGMYKRALAVYSMVLRMAPTHLMAKLNTATTHYNTGEYGQAISMLEKISMNHPNHKYILSHHVLLAKCYAQKGDEPQMVRNLQFVRENKPEILPTLREDPAFARYRDLALFR
ncbi:tetratricopeptide repeat protein [Nitrospina gracilis]|uniref:tetratricopeptide repeat protein n=1 Tax=Nitrospina gracilis TaxID=35801 RepID=UPI001F24AF9E|nr:tetratricopeptide repeat protein [Nitrospina gracilis]MCF8720187.1 tetratricopeptide (TPR) repeat protein [Nitrospina gracilis Nb-211]